MTMQIQYRLIGGINLDGCTRKRSFVCVPDYLWLARCTALAIDTSPSMGLSCVLPIRLTEQRPNVETVKMSSKGQIVIPKAMRDSHHLQPGVEFVIIEEGNSLRLMPVADIKQATVDEVGGILHRAGREPMSDDEMRSALRAKAKSNDDAAKLA
jgi:AbrB family looped-hinge helix DNA binding protein